MFTRRKAFAMLMGSTALIVAGCDSNGHIKWPSGSTACPIFQFFTWPGGWAMFGGTHTPSGTATGSPSDGDTQAAPVEDTPDAYAATSEYDDIRQMITSLRPAEQ